MSIKARIDNSFNHHLVSVETNGVSQRLVVSSKNGGYGSSVNGAEFLCVALATCFCNDLYREAAKRQIKISAVSVEASAEFEKEGEAGLNIRYKVKVEGDADREVLNGLVKHTDSVAEIQNTLRLGVKVILIEPVET